MGVLIFSPLLDQGSTGTCGGYSGKSSRLCVICILTCFLTEQFKGMYPQFLLKVTSSINFLVLKKLGKLRERILSPNNSRGKM